MRNKLLLLLLLLLYVISVNILALVFIRPRANIRDFMQTTMATATRTWKNNRSNCQNNSP